MEPDGIELYQNVEVNFISGKKAILTIFRDGNEDEKVTLSDYDDRDKLHELFEQKGFKKYTNDEMIERRGIIMTNAEDDPNPPVENLSPRQLRRKQKEKMRELVEARKNYMMVGQPLG
ncbi:hypothetical protein ACHAWU_009090 [Discostella pseudostelligera]|uniref:Uncharacterized protein n=1 Tax=Discostella pseudostelligera TaxID=259834 RepID=A0ABD3MHT9_9STRA